MAFYTTKQPMEVFPVTIDFKIIQAGEAISNTTITTRNLDTGQDTTGIILSGTAEVQGTQVRQRIHGGAHGETHRMQYRINTTNGNLYEAEVDVAVLEE